MITNFIGLFCRCQVPDIVVVLFDSSVRREESGFCNINQHLLCPCFSVCVISQCLIFLLNIIVEVKQCHEPVFAYQFVVQSFEIFFVAKCQVGGQAVLGRQT